MADLTIPQANHLHYADGDLIIIGGTDTLSAIQEPYHVLTSDDGSLIIPLWFLDTDPLDIPKLPAMQITVELGVRASLSETLPGLQISARSGSRLSKSLPELRVTGTATHETLITSSRKLPTMSLVASVGARCGTLTLADLGLSATASGGLLGSLSKKLPGLTIDAAGYAARTGNLDADLPPLSLSMAMTGESFATLAKKLPAVMVTATGSVVLPMSLDAMLPALESASTAQSGSMTLAAVLPPLSMGSMDGGISGRVETTNRYTDYVLRHVRFP